MTSKTIPPEDEREWRSILGWPYEVSADGRIRRIGRPRIMRFYLVNGYARIILSRGGEKGYFSVSRLVAGTWFGPIPDGLEVNHKDGVKTNNVLSNLEIVTGAQNKQHAMANGLTTCGDKNGSRTKPASYPRGERSRFARLTEPQVLAIISDTRAPRLIADNYSISTGYVRTLKAGMKWKHVTRSLKHSDTTSNGGKNG